MKKHTSIIKNKNGFTMVEILLVMGFIALASISTYVLYDDVKAAYVADAEIKKLGTLLERIDKSYDSVSTYSDISLDHVKELNIPIENKIDLASITSPTPSSVQFDYTNVTSEICTKFTKSLVYKGDNVSAIVNGQPVPSFAEIPLITSLCNQQLNSVAIVKNNPSYNINPNLALTNTPVNINGANPIPGITAPPSTGIWSSPVNAGSIDRSGINATKTTAQTLANVNPITFIPKTGITNVGTGQNGNLTCTNCQATGTGGGGTGGGGTGGSGTGGGGTGGGGTGGGGTGGGVTTDPELVENNSCHTYAYDEARTNSAYVNHSTTRDTLFLEQYNVFNYQPVSSRQVYEQTGTVPRWIPPKNPPPPATPTPGYYVYDPVYGWVTYYTYDWAPTGNTYSSCNYSDANCRALDYNPGWVRQEYKGQTGPTGRRYQERVLRRETDTIFTFNINPDPAQSFTEVDQQTGQSVVVESNWSAVGISPVPVAAWCTLDMYNQIQEAPYDPGVQELIMESVRTGPMLPSNRGWAPSYQASQLINSWFGNGGTGYNTLNTKLGITNSGNTIDCKSTPACTKTSGTLTTPGNFSKTGDITFTYKTVYSK